MYFPSICIPWLNHHSCITKHERFFHQALFPLNFEPGWRRQLTASSVDFVGVLDPSQSAHYSYQKPLRSLGCETFESTLLQSMWWHKKHEVINLIVGTAFSCASCMVPFPYWWRYHGFDWIWVALVSSEKIFKNPEIINNIEKKVISLTHMPCKNSVFCCKTLWKAFLCGMCSINTMYYLYL